MLGKILTCAILVLISLSACSTPTPLWRQKSLDLLEMARMESAEDILATEFKSAESVILQGEALFNAKEYEEAEGQYRLAFLKLELLEKNLQAEKLRQIEEAQRKAAEEKKALELTRAIKAFKAAEAKRVAEVAKREREAATRSAAEKLRHAQVVKERPPVAYYTVKRGESLPLIAAQLEVYGDRNLWPLVYRANRDQISDPRHIWPGQVFRIPRNLGRDDISEARHYAQERGLH